MIVETDIIGKTLYFYEMGPVVLQVSSGAQQTPVNVRLGESADGPVLLNEKFYPDFQGNVEVDIRDVVSQFLWLDIPLPDEEIKQVHLYKEFLLKAVDKEGTFKVNGLSDTSKSRISDLDFLRVPQDYLLPVSLHNFMVRSGIVFVSASGERNVPGVLTTDASGLGSVSRMIRVDNSPAAKLGSFHVRLDCGETVIKSPQYQICPGQFEQYLFANRYGGFDNIPMDGALVFEPETDHRSGVYSGYAEQVSSDADYIYTQHSGYVTERVLEAMSELICSGQIYHYKGGEFRRIVILETSLSSRNDDSLHSFSFTYKYADNSRPVSIRGHREIIATADPIGMTVGIGASPQTIVHEMDRYPSVTVMDSDKNMVFCDVHYKDRDTVVVTWKGDLNGFIYLI